MVPALYPPADGGAAALPASGTPAGQLPSAQGSKTRMLEIIKRHGTRTAQALAQEMGVSAPAARKHLLDLQQAGLVEARTERPGGRGRPQHVFALSEQGESTFPKSYAALCSDVLGHVQRLFGEGALLQVMDSRRADLYSRLVPLMSGDLETRLTRLALELKASGYASEAVQENGAWYLVERNCPALKVARDFPQLCDSELALYRQLLGVPVTRESRIACGATECRYRVG